jgi:hypothetical protein
MNPPDQPTDIDRRARAQIAHAESLGYVRCEPYASIGDKTPRWGKDGSYYSFAQLPTPALVPTPRTLEAAGTPSHDWEATADRLFIESQKLERELAGAKAECDLNRTRLASIFWSGAMDKFTGGDVQKWTEDYTAELTRLRAEVWLLKEQLRIESASSAHALHWAEKAEAALAAMKGTL